MSRHADEEDEDACNPPKLLSGWGKLIVRICLFVPVGSNEESGPHHPDSLEVDSFLAPRPPLFQVRSFETARFHSGRCPIHITGGRSLSDHSSAIVNRWFIILSAEDT